jgi:sugar phosphate isomerase/epimerase
MGIKRGVSLYSYQQEQFFKRMDLRAQIKEVRESLNTDGIEIIDQQTIRDYPNPSDEFVDNWHALMDEFNMKAVTMDVYMDVLQFRDHVMTHDECAERLIGDIKLAARLGFENVRCLSAVPLDVMIKALPTAEKYNVRMGKEIHAPNPIDGKLVSEIVEYVDKTNTKFIGLVPDMGVFQFLPNNPSLEWSMRHGASREAVEIVKKACLMKKNEDEARQMILEGIQNPTDADLSLAFQVHMLSYSNPADIEKLVPYIVSIHGKFYEMTEIEGKPGQYEDKSINYADTIAALKKGGFEGYINSEYEGQRYQQDRGMEYLADVVEEVRRHHEMLARLIGE